MTGVGSGLGGKAFAFIEPLGPGEAARDTPFPMVQVYKISQQAGSVTSV